MSRWQRGVVVVMTWAVVAPVMAGMAEGVVERDVMEVSGQVLHAGRVTATDPVPAAVLAALPGVDLLVQGVPGGQSDLSIRGSGFSGAGLSLNGFALPNAQTEHFNTELPLPPGMLSLPVIYTGFEQSLAGEGHLIGTVDFSILPVDTGGSLRLGLSEKQGYWSSVLMQQRLAVPGDRAVGIGAFAGMSEANAVDFDDNDVRVKRAGGQIQFQDRRGGQWDLLFARQDKKFGARGYYGVTPLWAASEETEDTFIFAGRTQRDREGNHYRVSALYREQSDDYTLFWTLPGVFNNRHKLETYGVSADGHRRVSERGTLDWRLTGSEQRIRSSALGDHRRSQMGVVAVPGMTLDKWRLQAGGRLEVFEDALNRFLPQLSAARRLSDRTTLTFAYSESVRQPSYTELNYESPASLGNAGLENQTASTSEIRLEGTDGSGFQWRVGAFYQILRHTVDWIREQEDSPRWEAQNIGTVEAGGVEAGLSWRHHDGSRLAMHYTGMVKEESADFYASRYALDYPEHLFQVAGYLALSARLGVEWVQQVRRQADHPLRGGSDTGYPASLALHALVLPSPRLQLTLAVNNLWDDDYEMFAGQATVSPQRFSAGMSVDW